MPVALGVGDIIGFIFDFVFMGFLVAIGIGELILDMFACSVVLPGVVADFVVMGVVPVVPALLGAGGVVGVPLEPFVVVGTLVVVVDGVVCASAGRASAKTAAAAAAIAMGFFMDDFLKRWSACSRSASEYPQVLDRTRIFCRDETQRSIR
jgi:hypothetical protein